MPYRIDVPQASSEAFDHLVALGALDAEPSGDGGIAAIMPDSVAPEEVTRTLAVDAVTVSAAVGRDEGSVWVLRPRPLHIGRLAILPASAAPAPAALRLIDSPSFGTGLHATTALCLEAIDEALEASAPQGMLDVGTGSGILALAALTLGVPGVTAVDVDAEALQTAAANARINSLEERLHLVHGGPEALTGMWPLVVANILAAPLIEMAPALAGRVAHRGQLVLSGVPSSAQEDVARAYQRSGMRRIGLRSRGGWAALEFRASW